MTISSGTRKAGPYDGNGVATAFPFNFKVFKKQDLAVTLTDAAGVESTLTLDSVYSVTLNADQDANPGGSVTYPISGSPLAAGAKLTISGALEEKQGTDITNAGGFFPQVVEDALDRLTILVQQVREFATRAIKFPVSDGALNTTLPGAAQRANKALVFGPTGEVGVSGDNYTDQVANVAASAATASAKAAEAAGYATTAGGAATTATNKANEATQAAASIDPTNIVHRTGDEQIAGLKNFVDYLKLAMMSEKAIAEDATGNYPIDFSVKKAANYKLRLTGNVTLSFTNVPAGVAFGVNFRFEQDATGSRTVTWPAEVKWSGGTAPVLTTTGGKADHISLLTMDSGVTWSGFVGGKNY